MQRSQLAIVFEMSWITPDWIELEKQRSPINKRFDTESIYTRQCEISSWPYPQVEIEVRSNGAQVPVASH